MKKFIMVFVCLMTMVVNSNAQDDVYVAYNNVKAKQVESIQAKQAKQFKGLNYAISGAWKDVNNGVMITFSDDRMVITDKGESLVLFKGYKKYLTGLCYHCKIEFPGIGKKVIEVNTEYDEFDSNHITLTIDFKEVDITRKYRLVRTN